MTGSLNSELNRVIPNQLGIIPHKLQPCDVNFTIQFTRTAPWRNRYVSQNLASTDDRSWNHSITIWNQSPYSSPKHFIRLLIQTPSLHLRNPAKHCLRTKQHSFKLRSLKFNDSSKHHPISIHHKDAIASRNQKDSGVRSQPYPRLKNLQDARRLHLPILISHC